MNMKHTVTLTITSLLTILFLTIDRLSRLSTQK
jgi:hypothetical protein